MGVLLSDLPAGHLDLGCQLVQQFPLTGDCLEDSQLHLLGFLCLLPQTRLQVLILGQLQQFLSSFEHRIGPFELGDQSGDLHPLALNLRAEGVFHLNNCFLGFHEL